jgi:hypothetical protein
MRIEAMDGMRGAEYGEFAVVPTYQADHRTPKVSLFTSGVLWMDLTLDEAAALRDALTVALAREV